MIHHQHEQGSEEWLAVRRGLITGSMFKVARDKLKNGTPSKQCQQYAMDLARERCGGKSPDKFQSYHMRVGSEQEAVARAAYEAATGNLVEEVGFFADESGQLGLIARWAHFHGWRSRDQNSSVQRHAVHCAV
jgi:hypothetical protein